MFNQQLLTSSTIQKYETNFTESLWTARDACIRFKVQWYEFGERSSEYFLNLEKRTYENKLIARLTKDDESWVKLVRNA